MLRRLKEHRHLFSAALGWSESTAFGGIWSARASSVRKTPVRAPVWCQTWRGLCLGAPLGEAAKRQNAVCSWEDVKVEVDAASSQGLSPQVVKRLFEAIPSLGSPPRSVDLAPLFRSASEGLGQMDSLTKAMMYYWCCKSRLADTAFLAELSRHITQSCPFEEFPAKHLVLMLYGSGWLIRHQRRDPSLELYPGLEAFVDKAARAVTSPRMVVQLKEQDLSNTLYSLGLLKYKVNEVLYPLLTQIEASAVLPRFLEQELANMLLGMASLGLTGHPTVAVLTSEVVERERLRMYKEPELCSLFYSLATLDYHNPHALGPLLREAIRSGRMAEYREHNLSNLTYSLSRLGVQEPRVWRLIMTEVSLPERLKKFENHHLANVVYVFGHQAFRDPQALDRIIQEASREERVRQYTTKECSLIMYGMSRTNYKNPVFLKGLSQRLAQPGRLSEESLPHKTLSGLLLSFASLGHRDPDLIKQYFAEVLHGRNMAEMDGEVLSQYIFALGKLKVPLRGPAEDVVAELLQGGAKLKTLSHRSLGMLIYGLGQMGSESLGYIKPIVELLDEGIGMVERFSVQDMAMLVYSFGQMRLEAPDLIDRVLLNFTRPDRLNKASTRHLSNLMYGLGLLRFSIKPIVLDMLESELARDSRIKSLSAQELANLVFSIGLLKIDGRPGIQQVVEKLTEEAIQPERLAQFQEMELNCLLTGLSHLHYREPTIVVPLLEEACNPSRLPRFKDQEIASIIHVMAHLGVCPDELCEKLLTEARKSERLETYDTSSLVMMVYSLGRLQNQNYPEAIKAFSEALLKSLASQRLGEQHLANFLYGVVHTRYDEPELLKQIFLELTKHHRLPRFHCGEILNIMRSVLLLRVRKIEVEGLDHVARIFAIEMSALGRIGRYSASQLTQVLQILGSLRNKNVATVFPILTELSKAENLHRLSADDVARAVFAVGPLAFVNRKLHPKLALAVKPILKQVVLGSGPQAMNCQSITELLVGLSMLGLHDTYLLDNVANEIIKPARLRTFRAWHLSRTFYAISQLRYKNMELLRALAGELSKSDRAQRLDYRHWSNILSGVLMLKFKDEAFAKVIEKQIHGAPPEGETAFPAVQSSVV